MEALRGTQGGYFDRKGDPIDRYDWARLYATEYRIVARTSLADGRYVSTVWLGIVHGFDRDGRPIIFETMVFGVNGYDDLYSVRYTSEEAAHRGHDLTVEACLRGQHAGGGR